jgi:hypothetical protein
VVQETQAAARSAAIPSDRLPASVTSSPLWRLASLGAASRPAAAKAVTKRSEQQALASYAKLGIPRGAKPATKQLSAAAALMKYAKLK